MMQTMCVMCIVSVFWSCPSLPMFNIHPLLVVAILIPHVWLMYILSSIVSYLFCLWFRGHLFYFSCFSVTVVNSNTLFLSGLNPGLRYDTFSRFSLSYLSQWSLGDFVPCFTFLTQFLTMPAYLQLFPKTWDFILFVAYINFSCFTNEFNLESITVNHLCDIEDKFCLMKNDSVE